MNIFVLTGAGVSAESGVPTFRDANGLWERQRIEEVATPRAFRRDPALVRRDVADGVFAYRKYAAATRSHWLMSVLAWYLPGSVVCLHCAYQILTSEITAQFCPRHGLFAIPTHTGL